MKKFLLLLLPLACLVAGCKYDDSDIWSELNSQAGRITSLESLVPSMNSNLISLQNTIRALEQNLTITSVQSNEKGYVISFSDGTTATILNGTNGTNGKDAQTPVIGIKADTDGVYYWTLNGSWLLDSTGKKVSSGSTPRLKVQDDQWYISYDNGAKWTKVEGQNASISSLFKSVTTDARNAYFNLSDGSVITVPLASTVTKLQLLFDESAFQKIRANEVLSTSYEIVAAEGAKVDFQTFESDGWTVTIYPTDDRTGRISIKSPEKVTTTKILFLLTDDNGGSFTKIITIGFDDSAKPNIKTQYSVDYQGGELVIPVNSCTATLSEGADWLEVTSVGDQVVLNVTSNDSYDWRQCKLTLEDGTVISITQLTQDALILSESVVQIDGRRQKVNFVVNTNIFVKAEVTEGSDWLSVTPSSRALSEKVFTFTVTRNTTEAERTATIVFSGNDLSETCTVIQAVYDGPATIDVTEAVATDEGTAVELNASYVTGLTTDGYVVTDGDSYIFVKDSANKPELGDSVTFKAVATPFNGVPALASVEEFTITKSTGKITYPTATDITSNIDSYSPSSAQYVKIKGDLSVGTDGIYHLAVAGASTKVIVYNPHYTSAIEPHANLNDNVTASGFWYGVAGGTLYFIATGAVANSSGGGDTPGTQTVYLYKKVTTPVSGNAYLIVAEDGAKGHIANPVPSNATYSYLQKTDGDLADGVITLKARAEDKEFVFEQSGSGYTIKQPDGRYLYQTSGHNNFNVDAAPSESQYWTIEAQADGSFKITNIDQNKYIQFDLKYGSYGSYAPDYTLPEGGIVPCLYEFSGTEEIEIPDEPGGGDEPGPGGEGTALTWELGTNASNAVVNGDIDALKLGTSKAAGSATITIPAGTKSISFYAVSWKNNVAKLVINDESGAELFSVSPRADDGAANNSPFTLTVSDSDKYTYDLGGALSSAKTVTLTTSGSKYRVIIFDIMAY